MAVRHFDMAFEAVYGVAAASGFTAMPPQKFSPKGKQNRVRPKIITGTRWSLHETRRAHYEFTWSLEIPLYYGIFARMMAIHMGAPVTAAVGGAAGAFTNTFKPGGTSIMSATFRWKRVSSKNPGEWYQSTGCQADKLKLGMNSKGIPIATFEGFGKAKTNIAAPGTPPTLAIEAYVHPDVAQQSVTKGGAAWLKLIKIDLESMQGLEPGWTIQPTTSMDRIELGDAEGTMKIEAYQDDYTGSLMETNDLTGLLGQVVVQFDDTTPIGTGTPTTPRIQITAPLPYTDDVTDADVDKDDREEATLVLGYDPTTASGWKWEFRNELAAAVFVGT